jgi:hypothetical protein
MKIIKNILLYGIIFLSTAAIAQPRISSNTDRVKLGRIEWKRPVKVTYTITNSGNQPLVMSNVTTSCACTIADWSKDPIVPGGKGFVTATFDGNTLGRFDKEVCIYSNANPNLVYLSFEGEVVRQVNDFSKTHPYHIGNIAIDRTSIDFPDAKRGDKLTAMLDVVNMSDRPYEPILMHLPSYISMKRSSDVLLKGQRGIIQLTLDTKNMDDVGLTQSSIYLSRFNGDKVSPENEIPISIIILPDFSNMTVADKEKAPVIHVSATSLDMTEALSSKNKVSQDISISNTGKSPLIISKVQVLNSAIGVTLKKRIIQPGETTNLRITVHKNANTKDKGKMSILMINDDPIQPKIEINIQTSK